MKKNPWVIIAVVQFFVIISLMSCSNNPLGVQEAGADPQQSPIAADKVMVNLSKTNMRDGTRADEEITLQEFVNQTEPDISDFLPGKTWTVKYLRQANQKQGYIKFNTDGTFECDDNGGVAIFSQWNQHLPYQHIEPVKYTITNNSIEFIFNDITNSTGSIYVRYAYMDFSDIKTTELKIPPDKENVRGSAILTPQE